MTHLGCFASLTARPNQLEKILPCKLPSRAETNNGADKVDMRSQVCCRRIPAKEAKEAKIEACGKDYYESWKINVAHDLLQLGARNRLSRLVDAILWPNCPQRHHKPSRPVLCPILLRRPNPAMGFNERRVESARKIAVRKAKACRALLERQLHYTKRHIAAGAEHIERQRQFVERLEAEGRGDSTPGATARALLGTSAIVASDSPMQRLKTTKRPRGFGRRASGS